MTPDGVAVEQLAEILHKIDDASSDPVRIDSLLAAFGDKPDGPFAGAGLFAASRDNLSFVLMSVRGSSVEAMRSWKRWPLRRLFARMKPTRILDPLHGGRIAFAVPLRYGRQRYVVVAPLRGDDVTDAFFAALESITVPCRDQDSLPAEEFPGSPVEPYVVAFSVCRPLAQRLSALLEQRGWQLHVLHGFHQMYYALGVDQPDALGVDEPDALGVDQPDAVIVDTDELVHPIQALRLLHRAARSELRVIAFESEPRLGLEAATLVDYMLPHGASNAEIFSALKTLVRGIGTRERLALQRSNAAAHDEINKIVLPDRLAQFAANRAASIITGWAGIVLVSDSGAIYRAEHPDFGGAIISQIPAAFLNDTPRFCTTVDERFLSETFDHVQQQRALMELKPVSAAAVPVTSGHSRLGVLLAVSRGRATQPPAFEAIEELSAAIGHRFAHLTSSQAIIPAFNREGLWERWVDRTLEVAVYRSRDCVLPWRYRPITERRGLLTIGVDDAERRSDLWDSLSEMEAVDLSEHLIRLIAGPDRFVGVVDAERETMTYAARDFSPPLLVGKRGPSGTIVTTERVTTGTATLTPSSSAVICDRRLWGWFGGAHDALADLPGLLDARRPSGLATLVKLGS